MRAPVRLQRRALPERLAVFVQLEARLLKVPHYAISELAPGIIGGVLAQDPAQEGAAPADGEAE